MKTILKNLHHGICIPQFMLVIFQFEAKMNPVDIDRYTYLFWPWYLPPNHTIHILLYVQPWNGPCPRTWFLNGMLVLIFSISFIKEQNQLKTNNPR